MSPSTNSKPEPFLNLLALFARHRSPLFLSTLSLFFPPPFKPHSLILKLKSQNLLCQKGPYLYPPSLALRPAIWKARQQTAQKKLKSLINFKSLWPTLPGLLLVGVSGSVATGLAHPADDIDLFFISRPHSLWLTRLFLRFSASLHKIPLRRARHSPRPNDLCPNLFLETASLSLPPSRQSLSVATDIVLAKIIYDPQKIWPLFLKANPWLSTFYPEFYSHFMAHFSATTRHFSINFFLSFVNFFAFILQYLYLFPKKRAGEEVAHHFAFFNLAP